jgi:hypothetical protein
MLLKAGTQLKSPVSSVEVVVIRAPAADVDVTCGGVPMVTSDTLVPGDQKALDSNDADGPKLGKRYANEEIGIECLCTKAGPGQLAIDGVPLGLKNAKPLPSSD